MTQYQREEQRWLCISAAMFVVAAVALALLPTMAEAARSQDPVIPLPLQPRLDLVPELAPTPPATPVVLITIIPGATWEHYAGPHYVDPDGYTHYPDGGIIEITQGEVTIYVPMTPESSVKQVGNDVILVDPEQDPES